jgi:hypothetical protein
MRKSFDSEAVMALCAPRRLQIVTGDRDPLTPVAGFRVIRETVGKVYGLYNASGEFSPKLYEGTGGELTRQKWELLLETLDKQFQRPGPRPSRPR